VDIGDWMLRLVDTAGLRHTEDTIEKLGIEVSETYLRSADAALACAETLEAVEDTAARLRALTAAPIIKIWTKTDLRPNASSGTEVVSVSAESREGLGELFSRIAAALSQSYGRHTAEELVVTTARQHSALARALEEVRSFERVRASGRAPTTIAAVHLREATTALEDLIGAVDVEDVLTRLFSTFCIGK
jgi:tRNA modification GTPase